MTVPTVAWVLFGVGFLVVGLIAASKSGKRASKSTAGVVPATAGQGSDQPEMGKAVLAI